MNGNELHPSRRVAESARQNEWGTTSFLRDMFLGSFRLERVLQAHVSAARCTRPGFVRFYERLKTLLQDLVDPNQIDETGEYPREALDALGRLGAFGMKIPEAYGGLGFTEREYGRAMALLGSYDANITALLSAHQSIGVPQPLKLFGTEAQKRKYLPRCAKGAISGFALTEPGAGSDPSAITSTAEPTPDGKSFILNGTKLWCTNGTIAKLLVVMARTPNDGISAFVVETSWEGVEVLHRCHFMGLKALANAELAFHGVIVPRENLIGQEGHGLKIALVTLNTGRLTLPSATSGAAKSCLEISRAWSNERVQWGRPIGQHEAIAHKLADMASSTFAMVSVAELAADLADTEGCDVRLEAAAAKEWNTVREWQIVDDTLGMRGGRGYETASSLAARAEAPVGVERMMRDSRINRIFEGSSEIMHLFMAREAVDKHLEIFGAVLDRSKAWPERLGATLRALAFYVFWYPRLWLGWRAWPKFRAFGPLGPHLRFIEAATRKLGRSLFHGILVHRTRLEHRQAFLFRLVDVAMTLFAMTAVVAHVRRMEKAQDPDVDGAKKLADLFCRSSRRTVAARFRELWRNDDVRKYRVGQEVLAGDHRWVETGFMAPRVAAPPARMAPTRAPASAAE